MKSTAAISIAFFLTIVTLSTHAQGPPPGDAAQATRMVEQVCAACHGADGNSTDPAYPKLAGQGAFYLYEQLRNFKAQGHRRASGVMGAMAVDLTNEDMRNLAAYFSQQVLKPTAPASESVDEKLLSRGETIYRRGIAARRLPACASCHGTKGAGLPPEFPRLGGQHSQYLVRQLDEFQSGSRASNPNQMMGIVAHKLTHREIDAVSQYIERLR